MKLVLLTTGGACLDAIEGLYLLTDEQRERIDMLELTESGLGHEQLQLSRETQHDQIVALDAEKLEVRKKIQDVITSGIKIPFEDYGIGSCLL